MQLWHDLKKFLNKSKEIAPTTMSGRLTVVIEKLATVKAEAWRDLYRPVKGSEVEIPLFHTDPEVLLVNLGVLNKVVSEGGYVDNAFNSYDRTIYSFDEWFTIRGEFVNFPIFIDLLKEELITLQKAFCDMEVCKVDKLDYYIKKSRMLLEDLENTTKAIVKIGSGL